MLIPGVSFQSRAAGVTQPTSGLSLSLSVGGDVEALPDVRGTEARRAKIEDPAGVTRCFQVSLNKVEPSEAVLGRNLFAKKALRSALLDEVEQERPEVPLVNKPAS